MVFAVAVVAILMIAVSSPNQAVRVFPPPTPADITNACKTDEECAAAIDEMCR